MATLRVLSYGSLPQGLTMKNGSGNTPTGGDSTPVSAVGGGSKTISLGKTFSRITMQSVLSEHNGNALNISNNNNVNTIVRKIKDFGMFGTVNGATGSTRKRTLSETKAKLLQKDTATKKPKLANEANNTPSAAPGTAKKALDLENRLKLCANNGQVMKKTAGTPGRKGLPLPQAVARRNARERNRVKQVNNGFAALRERIPEEVAEAFETPGTGRGSAAKKLSKVETLRMAVEYIRSLERLLGFDFPAGSDRGLSLAAAQCSSSEDSFTLVKDEFEALSPALEDNFDDSLSNYDMDEYLNASDSQYDAMPESGDLPQYQLDLLPNITTLNGLQYIRIPGTNTYQLLTPDIFIGNSNSPPNSSIDEEPFSNSALIDTNCLSPTTSTSTAADLHSSPPSIMASAAPTATATAPANALHPGTAMTTRTRVNVEAASSGECVNVAAGAALSRSPVPQSTSPTASSSLHHQQQQQQQQQHVPAVVPSPAGNEVLLRTCAGNGLNGERRFVVPTAPPQQQQILQPHAIKQECSDTTDFVPSTSSPTAQQTASPLFRAQDQTHYQQQQQQPLILGHATLSMSPPLERSGAMTLVVPTSTANATLQSFYERLPESELEQSVAFYEGVVTFKKELNEVLLHTAAAAAAEAASAGALSDESMMEAIDWWEAHTPKSDGGTAML